MYLKSLVLKGFKSFADRSVLSLEPGITAVVGPNGSGKSNISDAVLWVLGERNAKNLRGQVMEDVIFAGSSARKSVGVAEVVLVLDNTDGSLPIDYSEVSITRRMYRSGESEYLINGSIARRMDVLDILHDSGLGTATNSIISQGNLDQILQSKPEDRRALIEEAAGVLKHKQRKLKSERKLEQMDQHLARVKDVVAEVSRQLGPLERKAKRAQAYKDVSEELSRLTLELAVDDLRALQAKWGEVSSQEQALAQEIEVRRGAIEHAEEESQRIAERIRRESEDVAAISATRSRNASAIERLDSTKLLVAEKRRAACAREEELLADIAAMQEKIDASFEARELAEEQLYEASSQLDDAQLAAKEAARAHNGAVEARAALERCVFARQQERREKGRNVDELRSRLSTTQERLASGLGKAKLVEERFAEVERLLEAARESAERTHDEARSLERECERAASEDEQARDAVGAAKELLARTLAERDAAYDAKRALDAEIKSLEEIERKTQAAAGAARFWVSRNAEGLIAGGASQLARELRVDDGFEPIVESLLGDDTAAFIVRDETEAQLVESALATSHADGSVALLMREGAHLSVVDQAREAARSCNGVALIDKIGVREPLRASVEALLGDVVICDTAAAALSAHASCTAPVRFATRTGFLVMPSGKVLVGMAVLEDGQGAIARARRLIEAQEACENARAAHERASEAHERASREFDASKERSLAAQQALASVRGRVSAALVAEREAARRLSQLSDERADIERRRGEAQRIVSEARPEVDDLTARLGAAEVEHAEAKRLLAEAQDAVSPAREEEGRLSRALSDAKLRVATLVERRQFAEKTLDSALRDGASLEQDLAQARLQLSVKRGVRRRAVPLEALIETLAHSARMRISGIDAAIAAARDASAGTHAASDAARNAVKAAHDAFDAANERLTSTRVEKGRLEIQVEAAVRAIVQDCKMPIEIAEHLPVLEDRAAVEQEAFRLKRRIANMGTINPDAAEEYESVKTRYDYLVSQLQDLDSARAALAKINRVIDARMKDDFIRTFEQVNENFKHIFATLFPGGTAELSLTDPADLENTGVEVSAQPKGKRITKMMLMSGGEKSLVALALLFAAYKIRSTPFYILDEVEAALDDSNLRRLTTYLQTLRQTTQLIMITHQRRTMEMADVLFGVSMQSDGVTKVVSQRLDHALQYAQEG